jgi:hypothetical protein
MMTVRLYTTLFLRDNPRSSGWNHLVIQPSEHVTRTNGRRAALASAHASAPSANSDISGVMPLEAEGIIGIQGLST